MLCDAFNGISLGSLRQGPLLQPLSPPPLVFFFGVLLFFLSFCFASCSRSLTDRYVSVHQDDIQNTDERGDGDAAFARARSSSGGNRDGLVDTVGLGRVDLLASLGNLLEDDLVGKLGDDLGALVLEGNFVALDAVELLEDAVDGAGAAAAAHGDVELVGVRHGGLLRVVVDCGVEGKGESTLGAWLAG
jgi:hypothetical protein